jgi:hypothetical protein
MKYFVISLISVIIASVIYIAINFSDIFSIATKGGRERRIAIRSEFEAKLIKFEDNYTKIITIPEVHSKTNDVLLEKLSSRIVTCKSLMKEWKMTEDEIKWMLIRRRFITSYQVAENLYSKLNKNIQNQ